jgi:hypothetical protein
MKLRSILLTAVAASVTLFATISQAGYSSAVPRWVTLYPGTSTMGSSGYVRVVLSGTGVYTQFFFCSVGATDTTNCDLNYLYNSDQLLALYQNLQNAGAAGQSVAWAPPMSAPRGTVVWFGYP